MIRGRPSLKEKKQAFGNVSKQALSGLVFGKTVSLVDRGKDRYGRTIGEVFTPDGRRVEVVMVSQGMAWHYVKYAPRDTGLADAELVARRGVGCGRMLPRCRRGSSGSGDPYGKTDRLVVSPVDLRRWWGWKGGAKESRRSSAP
jgi:hypothetical protein